MNKLYLHDFHQELGARFMEKNDQLIPKDYGSCTDELFSAYNKLTVVDQSYFGKIMLTGKDALDLINRISTNDMTQLIIGSVCDTVFTTPKGRIVDYARVLRYDNHLILITRNLDANLLIGWINRFVILEDVTIKNVSGEYLWLTVMGPESLRFLRSISGQTVLDKDEQIWITHERLQFPAFLNRNYMVPAYNFCVPAYGSIGLAIWLAGELEKYGARFMGEDAFQILRIKSGAPAWGTELNEIYNPHEARLLNAVSFTKECYTGQEVIARLDTYDKVQKYLMILTMEERPAGELPMEIYYDAEWIGMLTSFTYDPISGYFIGLGFVKKHYAVTDLNIEVDVKTETHMITATLSVPPAGEPVR